MTKPNTTYRKLGEYIEPIDERNKDLSINNSLGISNDKYFQKPRQVADKPETHKIVRNGYFAYNRATTRNGEKISIALREGPDCTVSSAYQIFRVKDENILDSKYLMMWFRRPEFDRYARYMSHGSAHEFFEYEQMCDVLIPYIPISEQRAIVADYEAVERRIAVAKRTIATLQDTAQTLYRKMFVDGIDKENLPEGWRWGTLGEVAEITSGRTCPQKTESRTDDYCFPVAGAAGIIGWSNEYNQDETFMTTGRVGTLGVVNRYYDKVWASDNVLVLKSQYFEFIYQILRHTNYEDIVKGGVQALITQTDLKSVPVIVPSPYVLNEFEQKAIVLAHTIELQEKEIEKLTEIQTIILSGLGR